MQVVGWRRLVYAPVSLVAAEGRARVSLARTLLTGSSPLEDLVALAVGGDGNRLAEPLMPRWDRELRELPVGRKPVKRFKLPAPNQTAILTGFQEEGWPPRIDDPLVPHAECHPKRCLAETIKSLNRRHCNQVIHVVGDGTRIGVRWE